MQAQPLSKDIYNKAKELGVDLITLHFSGGSDEGYLDVELDGENVDYDKTYSLLREIVDWAWEVYSYSGAGEGTEYGDDITYDLKEGKVSTSEWYHVVQKEDAMSSKLEIDHE